MNIEQIALESLHEAIPDSSFSKHSTIGFVNFTINQFKDFNQEIKSRLNIDITDLNFHKWKTIDSIIQDIQGTLCLNH